MCSFRKMVEVGVLTIASRAGYTTKQVTTNHYQHFVNAYVLTNQTMKQADMVNCAQVEWKDQVVESEDQYVTALRKAAST